MLHAKNFLALNVYRTGEAKAVVDGDWTADNVYDGQPSLWIIVRRSGDIVASAQMDATARDGIRDLDCTSTATKTRVKVCAMLQAWVHTNAASVYPHPVGMVPPSLKSC